MEALVKFLLGLCCLLQLVELHEATMKHIGDTFIIPEGVLLDGIESPKKTLHHGSPVEHGPENNFEYVIIGWTSTVGHLG